MSRPLTKSLVFAAALTATEGLAYWWMHPAPSGLADPVLCYRPQRKKQTTLPPLNDRSSSYTPLPEIAAKTLPKLSATNGTVACIDRDDDTTIHVAFFEWDLVEHNSISVMEAFIHLPEECMGHIGMKLIEHRAPHACQVDGVTLTFDHTVFRDPAASSYTPSNAPGSPAPKPCLVMESAAAWPNGTNCISRQRAIASFPPMPASPKVP
jgi:hypothetical protein